MAMNGQISTHRRTHSVGINVSLRRSSGHKSSEKQSKSLSSSSFVKSTGHKSRSAQTESSSASCLTSSYGQRVYISTNGIIVDIIVGIVRTDVRIPAQVVAICVVVRIVHTRRSTSPQIESESIDVVCCIIRTLIGDENVSTFTV